MKGSLDRRSRLVVLTVAASIALAGGIAYAATSGSGASTSVIQACSNSTNGNLRIVADNRTECRQNEAALSWNVAGPAGPAGPQGPKGDTGPAGPQGPQGDAGPTGATGPQGPKGDTGPQGDPGTAGANGASAYDLWLAQGNSGSAADFLTSLKGATGSQGPKGDPGPQGPAGPAGSAPTIVSANPPGPFTAVVDGQWHQIPGFTLSLNLATAATTALEAGFSTVLGGGFLLTRVDVDGAPMPSTERMLGSNSYGFTSATTFMSFPAGSHQVTMEYRTNIAFNFNPSSDGESGSLQALVFG